MVLAVLVVVVAPLMTLQGRSGASWGRSRQCEGERVPRPK